ncbi:MAG: lipoprotein signal peptidase [Aureispira sp.]|nr:lipoprotein signal peptidase [Aureispira sp.]
MKRSTFVLLIIFGVLFIDQGLKIWVKLNMELGDYFKVFGWNWFRIQFTENPGMAFGMELGGSYGKLFLSVFRLCAIGVLGVVLYNLIQKKESYGLLCSMALIFTGALGNMVDAAFYGLFFTSSGSFHVPDMAIFDPNNGYAGFLYGHVVDMLYFPMINSTWPQWMPWVGGQPFQFFQPIFNIADVAISVGVVSLLLFHRSFFDKKTEPKETTETTAEKPIEDNLTA